MNAKAIVTWNTGRQYSTAGQRMAATMLPDYRVAFVDLDRGIDGITTLRFGSNAAREAFAKQAPFYDRHLYDIETVKGFVMFCYDYSNSENRNYCSGVGFDFEKVYDFEQLGEIELALRKAARAL